MPRSRDRGNGPKLRSRPELRLTRVAGCGVTIGGGAVVTATRPGNLARSRGLGYPRVGWTCSRRAPRSARSASRSPSACGRVASTELVGQAHLVGPGRILSNLAPGPRHPVTDPVGAAREWEDHAGPAARRGPARRADRRCRRSTQASRTCARRSPRRPSGATSSARGPCCSSTRSTGSRKTQQDALLPHVEAGTVTLIGATTENPSFGVVAALLSRCARGPARAARRATSSPASPARAVADRERGLARARRHARRRGLRAAGRRGRRAMRAGCTRCSRSPPISRAARRPTRPRRRSPRSTSRRPRRARRCSTTRPETSTTASISVFIKSMRGSDPDAAVYWMTRMLEAGEDPRFVLRRMVIFASEDVGNADPQALVVAVSRAAGGRARRAPRGRAADDPGGDLPGARAEIEHAR